MKITTGELQGPTMRQPPKGNGFIGGVHWHFSLIFSDWFFIWCQRHYWKHEVIPGPCRESAQVVQQQSQEHGGDSKREIVNLGELDRIPELPGPPLVHCAFQRWDQLHPVDMRRMWKCQEQRWRTLCCALWYFQACIQACGGHANYWVPFWVAAGKSLKTGLTCCIFFYWFFFTLIFRVSLNVAFCLF